MALTLDNDEIQTAILILATYPLDQIVITGDQENKHKALALLHKVRAHVRIEGDFIVVPEFNLRLAREDK
jgi:hypothetical protein